MTLVGTPVPSTREEFGWYAHGDLLLFSAKDMREMGFYVGPSLLTDRLPDGVDEELARLCGWWPELYPRRASTLREPQAQEMMTLGLNPYDIRDAGHNLMANNGITRMLNLLINSGATQAYDATHTGIGVGDGGGSVPTPAATDTDLTAATGATHRQAEPADSTFPSVATQVLTVQATFGTGVGLFHWREWAVSQDTAASTAALATPILNHKGTDMGDFTGTSISKALKITITES